MARKKENSMTSIDETVPTPVEQDDLAGQVELIRSSPITTIDKLREAYPDLVRQIEQAAAEKTPAGGKRAVGFPLTIGDPFGAGTLRFYAAAKGLKDLSLPYILPYKDKATKSALQSYIVRARGGGDDERTAAAQDAMTKAK